MLRSATYMNMIRFYRHIQGAVLVFLLVGSGVSGLFSSNVAAALPVTLSASNPEATVLLQASPPPNATEANLELTVFDPDSAGEGELFINGNGPIILFGSQASSANDNRVVTLTFDTPADWWESGQNVLEFFHLSGAGYRVEALSVTFQEALPVTLSASNPEETVLLQASPPPNATAANLELTIFDADGAREGELFINGNGPITLFGSQASSANDNRVVTLTFDTPADWWESGQNVLEFFHLSGAGYGVEALSVTFQEASTSALPVTLSAANPQAVVMLQASPSGNATAASLELTVFDPDSAGEGELFINGNGPIILFGSQASSANDNRVVTLTFDTPADWWESGQNVLEFFHLSGAGYRVEALAVNFQGTFEEPGDVVLSPGDDVGAIVEAHPKGTTFRFTAGTYRLADIEPKDNQTFIGEPGAILNGARILTGFVRDGSAWFANGQTQQGFVNDVECEPGITICNRPEQLFIDGTLLEQVATRGELAPGKWFFDYAADRIYMADNPSGHTVETSVTSSAFHSAADSVTIRGFIVEKYATVSGSGAIAQHVGIRKSSGKNWVIEDNEIRLNHSAGIAVFDSAQVRDNNVHHNGKSGISGSNSGLLTNGAIVVEGNETAYNNTAKYWWAGGVTFNNTDDLVIRDNYSHHNRGFGLWCDFDCINTTFEDNIVEDNHNKGIQLEISFIGVIRNNTVRRNGSGTWLGAGISVAESRDVEVYGNLLENNADGIVIRQSHDRGNSPKLGLPYESENIDIHDNHVTFTSSAATLNQVGTIHGLWIGTGDSSYYCCRNNWFSNNTYNVPSSALIFRWNSQQMTLADWHALGLD